MSTAPAPSLAAPIRTAAALLAVAATFLLVALVVGSLEAGMVWGLAGLFDLPQPAIDAGLLAAALLALAIGAKAARRAWRVERQAFPAGPDGPRPPAG